jgi:hypothetical protein
LVASGWRPEFPDPTRTCAGAFTGARVWLLDELGDDVDVECEAADDLLEVTTG